MPVEKYMPPSREIRCRSREHNPPMNRVYRPGTYVWVCPGCGKRQTFMVHGMSFREQSA